tara:strand:- start:772 stop:1908 length:1137 start_codon:yes stop_codon:yes gene_type:complete
MQERKPQKATIADARPENDAFKPVPARYTSLDDPFHMRIHMPLMLEALELMRNHSPLGAELYDWAKRRQVKFRFEDSYALASFTAGSRMVRVNPNAASLNTMVHLIAHELMHGVQFDNKGGTYSNEWDVRSHLKRSLYLESGAVAAQMRMAYEMKLNGYPGVWQSVVDPSDIKDETLRSRAQAYSEVGLMFEEAFESAEAEGKTQEECLKAGATAAYKGRMESQDLRNRYNTKLLSHYFRDSAYLKARAVKMDDDRTEACTRIKEEFVVNLEDVTRPQTDEDIFGDNKLMRDAADYLEVFRAMHGKERDLWDAETDMMQRDMVQKGNIFVGVESMYVLWIMKDESRAVLDVLCELAKVAPDGSRQIITQPQKSQRGMR